MAAKIDAEITKFIMAALETAKAVLTKNRAKLEEISKILIEQETIEREQFEKIVGDIIPKEKKERGEKGEEKILAPEAGTAPA